MHLRNSHQQNLNSLHKKWGAKNLTFKGSHPQACTGAANMPAFPFRSCGRQFSPSLAILLLQLVPIPTGLLWLHSASLCRTGRPWNKGLWHIEYWIKTSICMHMPQLWHLDTSKKYEQINKKGVASEYWFKYGMASVDRSRWVIESCWMCELTSILELSVKSLPPNHQIGTDFSSGLIPVLLSLVALQRGSVAALHLGAGNNLFTTA